MNNNVAYYVNLNKFNQSNHIWNPHIFNLINTFEILKTYCGFLNKMPLGRGELFVQKRLSWPSTVYYQPLPPSTPSYPFLIYSHPPSAGINGWIFNTSSPLNVPIRCNTGGMPSSWLPQPLGTASHPSSAGSLPLISLLGGFKDVTVPLSIGIGWELSCKEVWTGRKEYFCS